MPLPADAESWERNAAAWSRAVRGGTIASRRLGSDAAIVAAVRQRCPRRVLDLGCGEGWLCRALAACGIEVVGVDGCAALIASARQADQAAGTAASIAVDGGSRFHHLSYGDLIAGHPAISSGIGGGFDLIVANFSLLEADLAPLLVTLRSTLAPGGALLLQTVHPWSARGDGPYGDGWRSESFTGFGEGFQAPMRWYFRTLASWVALLQACGWRLSDLREPRASDGCMEGSRQHSDPLSLLLVAEPSESSVDP